MKNFLRVVAYLAVLALGLFVIRGTYLQYRNWMLVIYLALLVILPLLGVAGNIGNGMKGYKDSVRSMAVIAVGLLITTVLFKFVIPVWLWACLAGLLLPTILVSVFQGRVITATATVRQASSLINERKYDEALGQIEPARKILADRGNREGMAQADYNIGIAYMRKGDKLRAVRYLNNALSLYRTLGNAELVKNCEKALAELARQGADTTMPASADENKIPYLEAGFMFSALLMAVGLSVLSHFWAHEGWAPGWPPAISGGVLLLVFLAGNYMISAKNLWKEEGSRTARPRILFLLLFLSLIPTVAAWALRLDIIGVSFFPAEMREFARGLAGFAASLPAGILWAALIAISIGLILTVLPPNPLGSLLVGFGGFGRIRAMETQALARAVQYFNQREWARAIPHLSQIDLTRERDAQSKTEVLFALAFAHHMAGHPSESLQYIRELLENDPVYSPALFLAGYCSLCEQKTDDAEGCLRKLVEGDKNYAPAGTGAEGSARYYLSLCLYRKALQAMGGNAEESAGLLAEVGRMGALDRHVAGALIRVHLYRFVQMLRQRQWKDADSELALARDKLKQLEGLADSRDEIVRLQGLCQAAQGVLCFRQEHYRHAADHFTAARKTVKEVATALPLSKGGSILEQMLRSYMQNAVEQGRLLHANFNRDLAFLTGLCYLRTLADSQEGEKADWKSTVTLSEKFLEESIAHAPKFMEGKAMLGLIYYFFSEDEEKREKGIEMLETVRERAGSPFIIRTIADHQQEKQRRTDAQQAYFELLQQYMQFSSVPLGERQALREQFIDRMKQTGQYEEFMGKGGLEIDEEQEHQPSVQEYMRRSELLQEKIRQLCEMERDGQLPQSVQNKIRDIMERRNALEQNVNSIAQLERELLADAQAYL